VEQPIGFEKPGTEGKVLKLGKALYGLKQAPRAWYNKLDSYLISLGFNRSLNEATLYLKKEGNETLMVSVYVDDLLVTGSCKRLVETFKLDMSSKFEMNDLGCMTYFLRLELHQVKDGILVNQRKFASEMLVKFSMENCRPVDTPSVLSLKLVKDDEHEKVDGTAYQSLIESLLYLCASRPDMAFTVNLLSRFMQSPSEMHPKCAKRVLRYV